MLGKIVSLKFADHDITDEQKFPELERENYFAPKSYQAQEKYYLNHRHGKQDLRVRILNLLEIPHFG
jgi:hypothetical protein